MYMIYNNHRTVAMSNVHSISVKETRPCYHHSNQEFSMMDSQSHFPRLLMLFLGAGNELEDAKSKQKSQTITSITTTTWSSWIKPKRQQKRKRDKKGFICKHFSSWGCDKLGWINLLFLYVIYLSFPSIPHLLNVRSFLIFFSVLTLH